MNSIWTESAALPGFKGLEGDAKADVLILGGGITGILCAYFLQKAGVDYILAEGRKICSGVTKNTTAKITAQHGLIYNKLLKSAGPLKAGMYLEANQRAVKRYLELCRNIDCGFEEKTSWIYSLNDRKKLEEEAEALYRLGADAKISDTTELPFAVAGAVGMEKQGQFHPLKFLAKLAEGLKIYENTFVKELKEHTAVTEKGNIHFKQLIVATHFPIDNKHGMYFLKMYQHRSYVIALKNALQINGMYLDEAKGGMSFRSFGDYLLVGGGGHRTGKKGGNWQELRRFANKYYPDAEIKYFWAAQDCMSLDGIPYIGPYSPNMPGCYAASGYNKWGMTSSMTAAELLTDMVLGKENPFAEVFNPSRSMLKPRLLLNGCESVKNLLTPSKKRCPHLGCALKWNGAEQSWDCPCHGSRFDKDGGLIDNPANGNLKR